MISSGLFEILKRTCRPPSLPSQRAGWVGSKAMCGNAERTPRVRGSREVVVSEGPTDSVDSEGLSGYSPWEA